MKEELSAEARDETGGAIDKIKWFAKYWIYKEEEEEEEEYCSSKDVTAGTTAAFPHRRALSHRKWEKILVYLLLFPSTESALQPKRGCGELNRLPLKKNSDYWISNLDQFLVNKVIFLATSI